MKTRIDAIQKLQLQKGDVVLVKLGGEVGDGMPPWIPNEEELALEAAQWEAITPSGVNVLVHHYFVQAQIVRGMENATAVVVVPSDGKEG